MCTYDDEQAGSVPRSDHDLETEAPLTKRGSLQFNENHYRDAVESGKGTGIPSSLDDGKVRNVLWKTNRGHSGGTRNKVHNNATSIPWMF